MDTKAVTKGFSVSDQVTADDIAALKEAGVTLLICNRPDAEEAGQPAFAAVAAAAEAAGIATLHLPVTAPPPEAAATQAFGAALASADGAVHAFCRTGLRAVLLWALSRPADLSTDEIVAAGAAAGYDLSKAAPMIAARMA